MASWVYFGACSLADTVSYVTLITYGLVALLAGFIDTLAGGGGLITIPALLLGGIPSLEALGTNKLQGAVGTLVASLSLLGRSKLNLQSVILPFFMALTGGVAGAVSVQHINAATLDIVVPFVLIGIALYFLLAPKAGDVERNPRITEGSYVGLALPIIGFYDGFFGPGTGSFFALSGTGLRGWDLIRSTASAKIFNFASSLASLAIFIYDGKVLWLIGAAMIAGQLVGARLGAHAVVIGGAKAIKPAIVLVCLAMLCRYAWQKGIYHLL